MDDGTASNWGVLVTGLGLVALAATETGVGGWVRPATTLGPVTARLLVTVGFAGATVAFSAHRHGTIQGRPAGLIAVTASSLSIFGTFVAFFGPEFRNVDTVSAGVVPYLVVLLGTVAVALGVATARNVPRTRLYSVARALSVATGIGLFGYIAGAVVAQLGIFAAAQVGLLSPVALESGTVTGPMYLVLTVTSGVGFVAFGVAVARRLDRGWRDLDLTLPDRRDVGYAVGGVLLLLVALAGFSMALRMLGLDAATSSVEAIAADNPSFLLVMVPLSWLTIAPSEEFIYRNLIQKYLYNSVTEWQAVVLTSVVFGVVHFSQYSTGTPSQTAMSLLLVATLSILLGASYLRTENLLVPIFIHGTFNAIQFLLMYYRITGQLPSSLV